MKLTYSDYENIVDVMSSQDAVRKAVLASHDNNPWWPIYVTDWRMRILIAGLSTRVSFRMLSTYIYVINKISEFNYENFSTLSDNKLTEIVSPLGLVSSRLKYIRSAIKFIDSQEDVRDIEDNKLIRLINDRVDGAGYKVGACCALYTKGYHCGIIPVDSGIKDTLIPCIGLTAAKTPFGHEIARYQLEEIAKYVDLKKVAIKNGYSSLNFPSNRTLNWFMHLVVINFKRNYCNNKNPDNCPLKKEKTLENKIGSMCSKDQKVLGGSKFVIVEGPNGSGKTTLINEMKKYGFDAIHFPFDDSVESVYRKYDNAMTSRYKNRMVFDRSFISEHVYGKVLRGKSRLSDSDIDHLLDRLNNEKGRIVYLKASTSILKKRINRRKNISITNIEKIELISKEYEKLIEYVASRVDVDVIDTGSASMEQVVKTTLVGEKSGVDLYPNRGIKLL